MIFLDTNAVIYLYSGAEIFSDAAIKLIEANDCFISPMVKLELQYLREVGRSKVEAKAVLTALHRAIGLQVHPLSLDSIVDTALQASWTRDPFDRIITSHAKSLDKYLITSDAIIQKHYKKAIWK